MAGMYYLFWVTCTPHLHRELSNIFKNWSDCDLLLSFLSITDQNLTEWAICTKLISEWFLPLIVCRKCFFLVSVACSAYWREMAAHFTPSLRGDSGVKGPEWWFQFEMQFDSECKPLMCIIRLFSCGAWLMRGNIAIEKKDDIWYSRF